MQMFRVTLTPREAADVGTEASVRSILDRFQLSEIDVREEDGLLTVSFQGEAPDIEAANSGAREVAEMLTPDGWNIDVAEA